MIWLLIVVAWLAAAAIVTSVIHWTHDRPYPAEVDPPLGPADFDVLWPDGWITHACPTYEGRTFTHSIRFHDKARVAS